MISQSLSATPISTTPWSTKPDPAIVVAADPDLAIESGTDIGVDVMADLILQDIGGVELSKILRYDSLDGIEVVYSPMSRSSRVKKYNSKSLLGMDDSPLVSNGKNRLNSALYFEGETSRGIALQGEPISTYVDIQVAISGDWIPFSDSAVEVAEVF